MKSWIEGLSRLEDAEGDLDEFAHHGADDDHGDLAGGGETIPKGAAPSGFVQGNHGGHVQGLAQAGMADFREAGFTAHPATVASLLQQLAAHPDAAWLLPFIRALQAIVAGSRDRALADAPDLDYTMAAEILFLIETLEKSG